MQRKDNEQEISKKINVEKDLRKLIKQIPSSKLQDFVTYYAENNADFLQALSAEFFSMNDRHKVKFFIGDFTDIIEMYSYRGVIKQDNSIQFAMEVMNFFDRLAKNKKFIENKYSTEALFYFSEKIGNLKIEDNATITCDFLKNLWDKFIHNAQSETLAEIQKWLEDNMHNKKMRLMQSTLESIYSKHFKDEEKC